MLFEETPLAGAYVIELKPAQDDRGFFARTFCERELAEHEIPTNFPQCNLSRNTRAGTLRGLHYNAAPYGEAKIVRAVRGSVWDVIIDLRADSPTRCRWFALTLSADRGNALYIPEGFAHGFLTLEDGTDVFYHMGRFFEPSAARGLPWNDPAFGIAWPREPAVMSERDRGFSPFDAERFDG